MLLFSKKRFSITLFATLMLLIGVLIFPFKSDTEKVKAETPTTVAVVFMYNSEQVKSITLPYGESLTEATFPTLPELEEGYVYTYLFTLENCDNPADNKTYLYVQTGNPTAVLVSSLKENVTIAVSNRIDKSKLCTVTFVMPDKSLVTRQVLKGTALKDAPEPELGFLERAKYSVSLKNINSDLRVEVTIDNTLKYVFIAGCGAALLASLVVITIVIVKFVGKGNDDEEDDNEKIEEQIEA